MFVIFITSLVYSIIIAYCAALFLKSVKDDKYGYAVAHGTLGTFFVISLILEYALKLI